MFEKFQPLKGLLKEIAETSCRANAHLVDEKAMWPKENIQAIKDAGLAGLVIPKTFGGHGQGLLAMTQACEILAQECASTAMCYGMHLVGTAVISAKATSFHEEKILRPIIEGKHWTTLALSEPGTGAHFYVPQTQMILDAKNTLTLNGQKSFVTNGGEADSYVLSVTSGDTENSMGQFSCTIVPKDTQGLQWKAPWAGMGMRGNSSKSMELENVKLSSSYLLGEFGDQIWYVFEVVAPNFLMAMSGTYLGVATAALNEATEHLKGRHYNHNGAELSSLPVLQHRLGTLWAQVERTRQLAYSAASKGDAEDVDAILHIMSAKAEVADCAAVVVNECLTLMGGSAYGHSHSMSRHLRDARAAHVMSPTTDILRTWTGRALLGVPLLGD